MPTTTTPVRSNRFAGRCQTCHHDVAEGAGRIERVDGRWIVLHLDGTCPEVAAPAAPESTAVEPGVYVVDGDIVKVQANKAKTATYALRWIVINGERLLDSDGISRVHGEWEYEAGLVRKVRPDQRMSVEQAKAFVLRYGRCARCSRKLKAADSVERGIGPVCMKWFSF